MTDFPVDDDTLNELTDFHKALYSWLALSTTLRGAQFSDSMDVLVHMHSYLYKKLQPHSLEPAFEPHVALLNLKRDSERIWLFKNCISEAQQEMGYDDISTTTEMFRSALQKFSKLSRKYPREKYELISNDIRKEIATELRERFETLQRRDVELKDPIVSAYYKNFQLLRDHLKIITDETCCAAAGMNLADPGEVNNRTPELQAAFINLVAVATYQQKRPRKRVNWDKYKGFFESWLRQSQHVAHSDVTESVEEALDKFDKTLIACSPSKNAESKTNDLHMINSFMREFLRSEMHITGLSRPHSISDQTAGRSGHGRR